MEQRPEHQTLVHHTEDIQQQWQRSRAAAGRSGGRQGLTDQNKHVDSDESRQTSD